MPVLEEDIMGNVTPEHEMQCTAIHTIYLLITACTELGYQEHCFTVCQEVFTKLKVAHLSSLHVNTHVSRYCYCQSRAYGTVQVLVKLRKL